MKKIIWVLAATLFSLLNFAQVGVGTTNPDQSSLLDLSSNNKGFLPPRISLTSATDATTIPNPANGLVVYNTNANFANLGLYLNIGTSTLPDWRMLQMQRPSGTLIEYTSLDISHLINLNIFPNNDGIWHEAPDLRQNLIVSVGSNIKTVVTAVLNSLGGTYAQCDILVKLTSGTTPLATTLPINSSNPRDSFGVINSNGSGTSISINVAKSQIATTTNYIIQVYFSRANTPNNLSEYYLKPAYINTLSTK